MAQRQDNEPKETLAPVLVFPRRETVVDGRGLTFEWDVAPGMGSQRLEVAEDPQFTALVFEADVTAQDSLAVRDAFATDGRTYYWRVVVTDADGRVHGGDVVESFVGGTAEEAVAHHGEVTSGEEPFGPVGELFKGAAAEMAAEVTGDEEYFRREVELGVAHEGIAAGQIFAITAGVVLAIVLIVVTLIQYTQITAQEVRYASVGMSGYPERREAEATASRLLGEYGVVDAAQGVYRIPIERAIELMANETYQQQGRAYSAELPLGAQPQQSTQPDAQQDTLSN